MLFTVACRLRPLPSRVRSENVEILLELNGPSFADCPDVSDLCLEFLSSAAKPAVIVAENHNFSFLARKDLVHGDDEFVETRPEAIEDARTNLSYPVVRASVRKRRIVGPLHNGKRNFSTCGKWGGQPMRAGSEHHCRYIAIHSSTDLCGLAFVLHQPRPHSQKNVERYRIAPVRGIQRGRL